VALRLTPKLENRLLQVLRDYACVLLPVMPRFKMLSPVSNHRKRHVVFTWVPLNKVCVLCYVRFFQQPVARHNVHVDGYWNVEGTKNKEKKGKLTEGKKIRKEIMKDKNK
jgi:hypothetical protein